MKNAALVIGLVTAQAFAIGAFAQTTPTDPLALPNKPYLDLKPGAASTTAEGTTVTSPNQAKTPPVAQANKKMTAKERKEAREPRAEERKAKASGTAISPLYPNATGTSNSGPK